MKNGNDERENLALSHTWLSFCYNQKVRTFAILSLSLSLLQYQNAPGFPAYADVLSMMFVSLSTFILSLSLASFSFLLVLLHNCRHTIDLSFFFGLVKIFYQTTLVTFEFVAYLYALLALCHLGCGFEAPNLNWGCGFWYSGLSRNFLGKGLEG